MLTGSWQQPINITHGYTSCCLYSVDPPDDEQQAARNTEKLNIEVNEQKIVHLVGSCYTDDSVMSPKLYDIS